MITTDPIAEERTASQPTAKDLVTFRKYARGKQPDTLTLSQRRMLTGVLNHDFCDNVCGMSITVIAARLELLRFSVSGDDEQATARDQVEQALRRTWILNRGSLLASSIHASALRDGNVAMLIDYDQQRQAVTLSEQQWWDGTSGMYVAYDGATPRYAVREWETTSGKRRTVYYADRIERFEQRGKDWQPYSLDTESSWPVPWQDRLGQPIGLPVVHFASVDPTSGSGTRYGTSLLDGGLLGIQDEINDNHRDLTAAGRFTAYQMYFATGVTLPLDVDGNTTMYDVAPGAMLTDRNPDARFGTLPAGSLAELQRLLEAKLQAASRKTGVPIHFFGGSWPSGEAIFQSERSLTDRASVLYSSVAPSWASVMHKATLLLNVFDTDGEELNTDLLINAVFAPIERRDALTRAAVANAERPFVSQAQSLRTLGYDPANVDRILAERDRDLADVLQRLTIPGYSPQQALRDLGYTEEQIASMAAEATERVQSVGEAILTGFDRGVA